MHGTYNMISLPGQIYIVFTVYNHGNEPTELKNLPRYKYIFITQICWNSLKLTSAA